MPGIKELKNKIKSVKSTRKITKAMQMVSAAKMRKAQTAALNSRKYSDLAWKLINNLSALKNSDYTAKELKDLGPELSPEQEQENKAREVVKTLLANYPKATKTGIVLISTNKGLVGSFNTNLFNKLREIENAEPVAELLVMGKKAKDYSVRLNKKMLSDFVKSDTWTPVDGVYPLAKAITDLYLTGEYKQILIVYSHFVSTLVQKATVKKLLPLNPVNEEPTKVKGEPDYLFEPSPEIVLNHLVPRIIESQIYQAVLESDASEHSARMIMMKNATEAAGDLIADYTLTYNQLRQNKITTELAEITAGKIALE